LANDLPKASPQARQQIEVGNIWIAARNFAGSVQVHAPKQDGGNQCTASFISSA
jgi:hypothetical protein